ncbi:2-hydroxymuconate tautomerase family protein [Alteribacillus sp. YIM 98480]|uniref:2-hydroxymuconate tautomerase family protein n=1 Tax=Alteribacillus sp. YIM 98480 TaxID=2606599 RepID=UPI00131C1817|nr:2-hydroxymuconate tautomerase family protein [Alteribacillus sp. YIM 98480]
MPIAHIHILEGRDSCQKKKLIEEVTKAISSSLHSERGKIKVLLHEVSEDNWATAGVTKREEKIVD